MKTLIITFSLILLAISSINSQDYTLAFCYKNTNEPDSLDKIYSALENSSVINISGFHDIPLDNPDWSPDGEKIAVSGSINDSQKSIYTFRLANPGSLIRLTQVDSVWDVAPDWSPDGSKIMFTRFLVNQNFLSELWVMDSNGSNAYHIGLNGSYGRWSPNGDHIVFHFGNNGGYDIGICNADGTGFVHVTNTNNIDEISPVYSPDGTKLAYTSINSSGEHDICIMDIDGNNVVNLTENHNGGGSPKWSPCGYQIAFHQGGNIYTIDISGNNLVQITNYADGKKAINPDWHPDFITKIKQSLNLHPLQNHLYQNYPNPFNTYTKIKYYLTNTSFVRLEVLSLTGDRIAILEEGKKNSGTHEVIFYNISGAKIPQLRKGIYVYKLEALDYCETRKMIIGNRQY